MLAVTLAVGWQFDVLLCGWVDVMVGGGFVVQNKWTMYYYSEQWIGANIFYPLSLATNSAMFQFSPQNITMRNKHEKQNILPSKTADSCPRISRPKRSSVLTYSLSEAYFCSYLFLASEAYFCSYLFLASEAYFCSYLLLASEALFCSYLLLASEAFFCSYLLLMSEAYFCSYLLLASEAYFCSYLLFASEALFCSYYSLRQKRYSVLITPCVRSVLLFLLLLASEVLFCSYLLTTRHKLHM
jgi:hypothetical protein